MVKDCIYCFVFKAYNLVSPTGAGNTWYKKLSNWLLTPDQLCRYLVQRLWHQTHDLGKFVVKLCLFCCFLTESNLCISSFIITVCVLYRSFKKTIIQFVCIMVKRCMFFPATSCFLVSVIFAKHFLSSFLFSLYLWWWSIGLFICWLIPA